MNAPGKLDIRLTCISVGQRVAVAVSCVGFLALKLNLLKTFGETRPLLLSVVILLACVEKLCSIMNTVSMERDWVGKDHISRKVLHADAHGVHQVVVIADADMLRLQSGYWRCLTLEPILT